MSIKIELDTMNVYDIIREWLFEKYNLKLINNDIKIYSKVNYKEEFQLVKDIKVEANK